MENWQASAFSAVIETLKLWLYKKGVANYLFCFSGRKIFSVTPEFIPWIADEYPTKTIRIHLASHVFGFAVVVRSTSKFFYKRLSLFGEIEAELTEIGNILAFRFVCMSRVQKNNRHVGPVWYLLFLFCLRMSACEHSLWYLFRYAL